MLDRTVIGMKCACARARRGSHTYVWAYACALPILHMYCTSPVHPSPTRTSLVHPSSTCPPTVHWTRPGRPCTVHTSTGQRGSCARKSGRAWVCMSWHLGNTRACARGYMSDDLTPDMPSHVYQTCTVQSSAYQYSTCDSPALRHVSCRMSNRDANERNAQPGRKESTRVREIYNPARHQLYVYVDPNDSERVFVGAAGHGLWRSRWIFDTHDWRTYSGGRIFRNTARLRALRRRIVRGIDAAYKRDGAFASKEAVWAAF